MSAEQGWIGEPQPVKEWHRSIYSRQGDQAARRAEEQRLRDLKDRARTADGAEISPLTTA